jgi:hypothetical protein
MVKKYGITPAHLRSKVSSNFLSKNPQYKELFKRCPNCNKYALKPFESGRRCTQCKFLSYHSTADD